MNPPENENPFSLKKLIDVCIKSPSDSDKRCTSADIKRGCDVTRQADGWPGAGRGGGARRGVASRP